MDVTPTVVLLHGMGRTHRSMSRLRRRIAAAGYPTWARTYVTRGRSLEQIAERVAGCLRAELGQRPLVAVTHSLGGLIVRLVGPRIAWRGVVMLAPPNGGSLAAGGLARRRLFRLYFGDVLHELRQPEAWPAPPSPCGVIAGTSGASLTSPPSWLVSALALLPPDAPSDGTLTVEETRVEGMTDFATVEASHTWIMNHPRVAELVLRFLATGRFDGEVASG